VKKTLEDLLKEVGYFDVYDPSMGGTVVSEYTIDDIDYVQVVYSGSPETVYTYLKGDNG
jgi:effector-binding domain-containing protein